MRYLVDVDKTSLEDLAHTGVKGMKWGVRKAYTTRLSKGVKSLDRVASGDASVGRKAVAVAGSTAKELIRGRGVTGAAQIRRDRAQAHIDRINEGRATTKDILAMVRGISMSDLVRGLGPAPKGER